ncbi:unnamed protein product [Musa acuminata subsp. burmannicoides]
MVEALGLRPDTSMFVYAIRVMNGMWRSTWEAKLKKEQSEELGNGILPCDHEDKLHRRHDCTWGIWQGRKIIRVNDQLIARGSLLSLTLWILDVGYTCKSIVPRNFGRC